MPFELVLIVMLITGEERMFTERPLHATLAECNMAAVALAMTIRPNPSIGIYRIECQMVHES